MFNWMKNLFKKQDYCLGYSNPPRPFPNKLELGKEPSPAAKLHMVMELMGGKDHCPECGQEIGERPQLINTEEALKLLGFKK